MTEKPEIDVEELRAELDQIKDAMGLQERYEGAATQWLLFGVLVAIAAGLSQYVFLADLPGYWYGVIWIGLLFGGGAVGIYWIFGSDARDLFSTNSDKPGLFFIFWVVYLASIPLQVIASQYTGEVAEDAETMFVLAIILVMIGVAYVIMGNVLKAYYIRARDRYAFYGGGLLMAALGTAIPFVEVLQTWGYAVLGVVYLAYALATYVALNRY